MSTNYPGNIDSFTNKTDNQDTILAVHINNLQDSVKAIQTVVGTNPAGSHDTVKDYLIDLDSRIDAYTLPISDKDITLSAGNIGLHTTLAEHVLDPDIHTGSTVNVTSDNFPFDLDTALDQLLRGTISTGNGLTVIPASDTTQMINAGDIVFCHPLTNPSATGYGWHIVTESGTGPSGDNLRLDGSTAKPTYSTNSLFARIRPSKTSDVLNSTMVLSAGDLVFCYSTSNPQTTGYNWHIVTTGATGVSSSALRLDNCNAAPVFQANSFFSVLVPLNTILTDNTSAILIEGDLLFCHTTSNPTSSGYGWHVVTTGGTGSADTDLRLDDCSSAPVFSTSSRISIFRPGSTAEQNDTTLCINKGDVVFGNISGSGYGFHIVTANATGVSSTSLRVDDQTTQPIWASPSRFSNIFPGYQGVGNGGEILEIAYTPGWFFITTSGTGTGGSGTSPAVYGNITTKLPMPSARNDEEFTGEVVNFSGIANPPHSTAFRTGIQYITSHEGAYKPESGMIIQLSETLSARGFQGAGITNRPSFAGSLECDGNPVIGVYGMGLSANTDWLACMPVIAKVLDGGSNSRLSKDEMVLVLFTSTSDTAGIYPCIITEGANTNSVDIFKLPSNEPYFGNGSDGDFVIDGTIASNSTNGKAWPGGQLIYPSGISPMLENTGSGGLAQGDYAYRVVTVDQYDNETNASTAVTVNIPSVSAPADIKLTWTSVIGAKKYRVYGRNTGNTQYFLNEVTSCEYTDNNTDTPTTQEHPTTNNSDGCFRIDSVKYYRNVTLQNNGGISVTPWDGVGYGKLELHISDTLNISTGCTIDVSGKGYRGGNPGDGTTGYQGESYSGTGILSTSNNAGGGGGGLNYVLNSYGGAGGGYGTAGKNSQYSTGGTTYGTPDLSTLYHGSGGGGANTYTSGARGGGIIKILARSINLYGTIKSDGSSTPSGQLGGAGSGGSVYLTAVNMNINSLRVTAIGGIGNPATNFYSGDGGIGRIRLDFKNLVGTTNPPAYKKQI